MSIISKGDEKMKTVIGISQTINIGNYESIKPEVQIELQGTELEDDSYYEEAFKKVEKLWNKLAKELITSASKRRNCDSLEEWLEVIDIKQNNKGEQ